MTIPSNSSLSSVVVPTMLLIEVLLLAILPTSTYGEICSGKAASPNWYGSAAYPPYFTRNTAEKCVQKYALSRCEQSGVMKDGGSNFTVNSVTGEEVCTATVDCLPTKQNCNDTLVCSDLVKLKDELMEGGHNIVCRHEKTYWSQYTGEAKNCHLHQNCLDSAVKLTQRQLQPLGWKSAKHFANAFIQMGVPIGKTYSSPFTRCAEHAQLFSQEPNEERLELLYMSIWEEILALQNITSLVKVNALKWQAYNMRNFAGKKPAPGKNNIMITHGFNIKLAFGTAVDEGYCMVLKPEDTLPSLADSIGSLTVGNRQFIFDNDSFPVDAIARMSPESALLMQTCDDVRTDAIENDDGALATIDADHDMKISREEFISAHNDYDDDKGATSDQAYDAFDFISSVIIQPELFGYYKSSSSPSIELGQFFHINWGWREYLKTGGDISYPWRSIIENTIGSLGNNSPESRVASFKQANSILSNLIIALRDQTTYPSKVYMESKLINCDTNFIAEYAISNCAAQVSSHHGGAFDYIPIGPGDGGSGTLDGEFIFDLPLAYPSQWKPERSHFFDNRLLKVANCLVHEEFITLEDTLELMGCSVGQKQHDNEDEDEDTACATEHENAMTCGSRNGSSQCCDGLTCHSHASTCVKEENKTCASVNMLAKECGSTNNGSSPECCSGLTCDYVTSKCASSPDNDESSHSASLTHSPTYTPIGIGKVMATPSDSSAMPTFAPSAASSLEPTDLESTKPSYKPSVFPSSLPSSILSKSPSSSTKPSFAPSAASSSDVSLAPSPDLPAIENVAFKKPTSQSSSSKSKHGSSKAVDDNNDSLSRTKWEQNPYWEVSLEAEYKIKTIELRLNAQKLKRAKGFRLEILNEGVLMWIYEFAGVPVNSTVVLDVPEITSAGDEVKISLVGTSRQLELREIKVMASARPKAD